jgi:peptide/nickel transport system substrate-binding protein
MTAYLRAIAHNRRLRWLLAVGAVASVALTACSAGGTNSNNSGGGSALNVGYTQPLQTLDPIHSDQNQTNSIDDTLYDTLLTYDAQNNLIGSLATAYTVAPNSKSVDITLRSGVKFHDGSELTSADVKYTFDRYVAVGQGIASQLSDYASTAITDPTHLTINLKTANALFPANLSKLYILEQKLVSAHAGSDQGQAWLQSHDAGSGPFQVTNGTVPVSVSRFADFWQFDPKRPKGIVFQQIAESPTKADKLKSGDLDIALNLQTADAKGIEKANGVTVDWVSVPNAAYIFMNTAYGPTANPVVRKAMQLAYNYSGGLNEIRGGEGQILNGPLPQSMPCLVTTPAFSQNLAEAKSMLASAGLSNLKLTLRFQPSISDQVREATLFQSDLRTIGVNLTLTPITFPDYLSSLSHPSTIPSMVLLQDTAPLPDSGVYLIKAYDSSNIGTTNRGAYKNATVDNLLNQATVTNDANARCGLYKQAQDQINKDAVAIDMYTLKAPLAYRTGLTGVAASQLVFPMSLRGVRE